MGARQIRKWLAQHASEYEARSILHAARQRVAEYDRMHRQAPHPVLESSDIEPEPCHFCTFGMGQCTCNKEE